MGNTESNSNNTLESLNKNLALATFNAQKHVQHANLEHLQQFFHFERERRESTDDEEEKGLDGITLVPKCIKIRTSEHEIKSIPICSLVNVNFLDIKDVNIKTKVEIKNIKSDDITTCTRHNENTPYLELDMKMTSVDVSENISRFIHKFHL
jgi:hypothetical protein